MAVHPDGMTHRPVRNVGHSVWFVTWITCECGSQIPMPRNPEARPTVTVPCLNCKCQWVFNYALDGHLLFCQKVPSKSEAPTR